MLADGREVILKVRETKETGQDAQAPPGIYDPSTRKYVDPSDADALIDLFARMDNYAREAYRTKQDAAHALAELTEGDAKTRRVKGNRRSAKVTMQDDGWDQSMLQEAWNSYPQHRNECLKIGAIKVKKREFNKLVNTTGKKDFEQFKAMVKQANQGPRGTPRITVEE